MKTVILTIALLTGAATAHAEQSPPRDLEPGAEYYSTYFAFSVRSAGVVKTVDTTPAARVAIDLPAEFVGWRCFRTPQSSVHSVDYENIACWHGVFTVGISLSCHNNRESHDAKNLFLRAPGANGTVAEMQITGACVTTLETVQYDDGF